MEHMLEFREITELNIEIVRVIESQVNDLQIRGWRVTDRKHEGTTYFVKFKREGGKTNLDDLKARDEAMEKELVRAEGGKEPDFEILLNLNTIRAATTGAEE